MKFSTGDKVRVKDNVYSNFLLNLGGYCVCATKGSTATVVKNMSDGWARILFDTVEPLDPGEWYDRDGTPYMFCWAGKDQVILEMYLEPIQ